VALGTRHGKQHQVGPVWADLLGVQVVVPPDLDTDQFGTFTGERPRSLTPLAAARAKARLAMDVTGLGLGLASEASYGPLPGSGWPGHEELLLFVDDTRGVEILQGRRSLSVPGLRQVIRDAAELRLSDFGWPEQAVIVRPATGTGAAISKGLTSHGRLSAAIAAATAADPAGQAIVEPDLRAHHNPSRRRVLTELSRQLAERLLTACPNCGCPGFGRTGTEAGLPCASCGAPTDQPRADLHSCARCDHRERRLRREQTSDPRWCPYCNP
jgi:hypothetical protein